MQHSRIVILAGQAGSGKDTVGSYIVRAHGGLTIGQADPMKRFARDVLDFSEAQLWGPSDFRNARDVRFDGIPSEDMTAFLDDLDFRFQCFGPAWIKDVLGTLRLRERREAYKKLDAWLGGLLERIARGEGLSPRYTLQTLGTEWGRQFSANMWVDYAVDLAHVLLDGSCTYDRGQGLVEGEYPPNNFAVITDGRFRNEMAAVRSEGGIALRIVRPDKSLLTAAEAGGIKGHQSERELGEIPDSEFNGVLLNDGTLEQLYHQVDQALASFFGTPIVTPAGRPGLDGRPQGFRY